MRTSGRYIARWLRRPTPPTRAQARRRGYVRRDGRAAAAVAAIRGNRAPVNVGGHQCEARQEMQASAA
eukprot:366242-Chlamydomonas_euryale.AAC.10